MPEPSEIQHRPRRGLLIWAVTATIAAVVFGNTTLMLFMKLRHANARPGSADAGRRPPASTFSQLQDSEVAGQYQFFHQGTNVGVIALLPDHTIVNTEGATLPQYRWELKPHGIVTTWQRSKIVFNTILQGGVYAAFNQDGSEYRRIEKVEP
jgi:hypothetical protein